MSKDTFQLSRRKALAALGTVGVASAGAGLGTSAYFSDTESFEGNSLTAGSLDLKAAVSQHYVDWLPDTDVPGNVSQPSPQETDDARMPDSGETPDIKLNPGSDGADTKASPIELVLVDDDDDSDDTNTGDEPALEFAVGSLVNNINGGVPPGAYEDSFCADGSEFGGDDDNAPPIVELNDVKPGDFGFIRFAFESCTNPAFVSLMGDVTSKSENGVTEPEADDPDEESGKVELLDEVQLAVLDTDVYQELANLGSGATFEADPQATLRDLDQGLKLPLDSDPGTDDRDCYDGETNYRGTLVWWLPVDHANEIQTDSAEFSLGIYAEQCRHNDGETVTTVTGDGFGKLSPTENKDGGYGDDGEDLNEPLAITARARHGDSGGSANTEVAIGAGDNPTEDEAQVDWGSVPYTVGPASWTLSYDASDGSTEFSIGGTTVSRTTAAGDFDGKLIVQTKADEATVTVSNLSLAVGGQNQALDGPAGVESADDNTSGRELRYLVANTMLDGSQSFELSGTAEVSTQSDFGGGSEDWAITVGAE